MFGWSVWFGVVWFVCFFLVELQFSLVHLIFKIEISHDTEGSYFSGADQAAEHSLIIMQHTYFAVYHHYGFFSGFSCVPTVQRLTRQLESSPFGLSAFCFLWLYMVHLQAWYFVNELYLGAVLHSFQ